MTTSSGQPTATLITPKSTPLSPNYPVGVDVSSRNLLSKLFQRWFAETGRFGGFLRKRTDTRTTTSTEPSNLAHSFATTARKLSSNETPYINQPTTSNAQEHLLSHGDENALECDDSMAPPRVMPLNNGSEDLSLSSQTVNVNSPLADRPFFSGRTSFSASIVTTSSAEVDVSIRARYLTKTSSRTPASTRPHSDQPSFSSDNTSTTSDPRTFYTATSSPRKRIRPVDTYIGGRTPQIPPLSFQRPFLTHDEVLTGFRHAEEIIQGGNESSTAPTTQFPIASIPERQTISKERLLEQVETSEEVEPDFHSAVAEVDFEVADVTDRLKRYGKQPMNTSGGHSDIWKGELHTPSSEQPSCQPVAIKVLRAVRIMGDDKSDRLWKRLRREAHTWCQLQNDYIVPLIGFAFDGQRPCLISPWYEHGNVLEYIAKNPGADRNQLIANVIDGLIYLHAHEDPVVHGDLKAANVIVDDYGSARITDFGLSKFLQGSSGFTTSSALQGSTRWMAPELFFQSSRTTASDIYSLTLLVLEIYSGGKKPFGHLTDIMFVRAIAQEEAPPISPERSQYPGLDLPEQTWQVLEVGWHPDPTKRPSAEYFKKLYFNVHLPCQQTNSNSQRAIVSPSNSLPRTSEAVQHPTETAIRQGTTNQPKTIVLRLKRIIKTLKTKVKIRANRP